MKIVYVVLIGVITIFSSLVASGSEEFYDSDSGGEITSEAVTPTKTSPTRPVLPPFKQPLEQPSQQILTQVTTQQKHSKKLHDQKLQDVMRALFKAQNASFNLIDVVETIKTAQQDNTEYAEIIALKRIADNAKEIARQQWNACYATISTSEQFLSKKEIVHINNLCDRAEPLKHRANDLYQRLVNKKFEPLAIVLKRVLYTANDMKETALTVKSARLHKASNAEIATLKSLAFKAFDRATEQATAFNAIKAKLELDKFLSPSDLNSITIIYDDAKKALEKANAAYADMNK